MRFVMRLYRLPAPLAGSRLLEEIRLRARTHEGATIEAHRVWARRRALRASGYGVFSSDGGLVEYMSATMSNGS